MMFYIIFIFMLAVPITLWVKTKNSGWTFVIALVVQIGLTIKWKPITWETVIFWLLIIASLAALFILKKKKWFQRIALVAMILAFATFTFVAAGSLVSSSHPSVSNVKPTQSATSSNSSGHTTWKMAPSDYANNRWFANGIQEIKDAKTDAEAVTAVNAWLEKVKTDPNLLVGATKYFLNRDIDKTTLVDKDGWATDSAVQLVTELQLSLGQAKAVPANAPTTGFNSGVENNKVVSAATSGISGDTKSIQVTLSNGKKVWIMGRCGNIVTPEKPSVPPGKTDNTPTPTPVPTPTPPTPVVVVPVPVPPTPPVTVVVPVPVPPTPSPTPSTGLVPKSSNPSDYQQPGTDTTKDSGTGTKPAVPVVTTPAESTPPTVVTSHTGSNNIVDTPTNKPSTETGVTAPSATPKAPSSTSTPTPSPEPGVNPSSGGTNKTDPGNPF